MRLGYRVAFRRAKSSSLDLYFSAIKSGCVSGTGAGLEGMNWQIL